MARGLESSSTPARYSLLSSSGFSHERFRFRVLVDAVLLDGLGHGAEVVRVALVDAGAAGEDEATALAAVFDEVAAVVLDLLRGAGDEERGGHVALDAGDVPEGVLGLVHVRLVKVPEHLGPGQGLDA